MNHARLQPVFFRLASVCSLLFVLIWACRPKDDVSELQPALSVAQAQQWFTATYGTQAARTAIGSTLHPVLDWSHAESLTFSGGKALRVPVSFEESHSFQLNLSSGVKSFDASQYTSLLIYTDAQGQNHAERITRIPDEVFLTSSQAKPPFSGFVRVEDWQGKHLKTYQYLPDGQIRKVSVQTTRKPIAAPPTAGRKSPCVISDWYTCHKEEGQWVCYYDWTEIICGGGSDDVPDPGDITFPRPPDYGTIGGGGSGGTGSDATAFPANPSEGQTMWKTAPNGTKTKFIYTCNGKPCGWYTDEIVLGEVEIVGNPERYRFLPPNPKDKELVWGTDGFVYTYEMRERMWHGKAATPVNVIFEGTPVNPKEELKCFDLTKGAKLTIFVQQSNPGTRDKMGARSVGHTFVGIEQGGITRYVGYYPPEGSSDTRIALGKDYPAEIRNNTNHSSYDVSVSKEMTPAQLNDAITYIKNFPPVYNLNNYNCTDFAIAVAKKGGLNLPVTTGDFEMWGIKRGSGRNPGDLGEDIRAMQAPAGVTIDKSTTEKKGPPRKGGC